ncbi:MAG: hypothetical protein ACRCX2_36290 [Paraclostridium sp.]
MHNKFIHEEQIRVIISEVLKELTFDDSDKIKKHILEKRITKTETEIERLDVAEHNTLHINSPVSKYYIKLNKELGQNLAMFTIDVTIFTDEVEVDGVFKNSSSHSYGIVVPHRFDYIDHTKPVCAYVTGDLRKLLPSVNVSLVRSNGNHYIEVNHMIDIPRCLWMAVTVCNYESNTELQTNITPDNILKTESLELFPIGGFDDIPERHKIVRSETIKKYEVIEEEEYQFLEDNNLIDSETMYSIPEKGGING